MLNRRTRLLASTLSVALALSAGCAPAGRSAGTPPPLSRLLALGPARQGRLHAMQDHLRAGDEDEAPRTDLPWKALAVDGPAFDAIHYKVSLDFPAASL